MTTQIVRSILLPAWLSAAFIAGCTPPRPSPAPMPVAPPPTPTAMADPVKPLPEPSNPANIQPGFDDVPLVTQQIPESPRFIQAYNAVGRPRIMVFVNRTLDGGLLPVNDAGPVVSVQDTRQSNAAVKLNDNSTSYGYWHDNTNTQTASVDSPGAFKYTDRTDIYLQPGQYDEASARQIDYEMIENTLTDWLSSDGQVTIISPIAARQRLTDAEVAELQSGRPQMMGEIAQKLQTDVLVQVECRPSRQSADGLVVTLIAQALNTKGGQELAQGSVQVTLPMEKTTVNRYTRFIARKLMLEMTNAWNAAPMPAAATPATTQP